MVKEKSFNKMTPSEKRVTLARDVIAQVKAKKLLPMSGGTHCDVLKDTGKLSNAKCEVCGIGALFVSHMLKTKPDLKVDAVLLHDEEYGDVVADGVGGDDIRTLLKGVFSSRQLADIEDAFEQTELNDEASRDAPNFFAGLDDLNAEERLVLIMENIIANRGTFRVDRKPEFRLVTPGYGG